MAVADQSALPASVITAQSVDTVSARWSLATRVAFRLCFGYFGLYILFTQMLPSLFPLPFVSGIGDARATKAVISWTASHVFRIAHPILTMETGSGDRFYDWVKTACILALAISGMIIWSIIDRKRLNYPNLYKWFRLFARFALAATMFTYGFVKIVPLQMPFPFLTTLLEPYGHFSPMGVLWSSVGASTAYQIFAGSAETLAGLLLILPRTSTLGALIALADMTQVFVLNMTYDVPVKLFSLNMILLAIFLLAPEAQRLANFFFLDRSAPPSSVKSLFRGKRANRIALALQIAFGLWLIGTNIYGSVSAYYGPYGPDRPKPPLYGIWNVQDFTVDGQTRAPLLTDTLRWRRLIFEFPQYLTAQAMDDSFHAYSVRIDTKAKTFTLTKYQPRNWKADFSYSQPSPTELILDGSMDGHKIHAQLELFDIRKFLLVSRGFHWIQDHPFNQ